MAYTGPVWTGNRAIASAGVSAGIPQSMGWTTSTHSAGDTGFMVLVSDRNVLTVTDPNWSLVASEVVNPTVSATAARIAVWRKSTPLLAPTSEPPTAFSSDSAGFLLVYGFGVSPDAVVDVVATSTAATATAAVSYPGVTTGGNNRLILHLLADARDAAGARFSGATNANLTNLVERLDDGTTQGSGGGLVILSGEKEIAGATGNTTGTLTSSTQARITVALKYATEDPIGGGATANGATITTTAALTSGSASATRSPTASGATITSSASLVPGAASASLNGNATGLTLSTSATITAGSASAGVNGSATGATISTSATGSFGSASGVQSPVANGDTLTTSASLTEGSASGEGGSVPWTPAYIDTLLWLDLNDGSTVTESGGLVTGLTDKSDSARTITIGSGVQPAYEASGINSMPAAYFTNDRVEFTPQISAGVSVIAATVYRGETQVLATLFGSNNTALVPIGASSSATNTEVFRGVAVPTIRKHGSVITWANRGQANTALTNSEDTLMVFSGLSVTDKLMYVGAGPFSYFFKGRIGETLLVPSTTTFDDVQRIEGYLAWKWGTQAALPADHPYKAAAPTVGGGGEDGNATGAVLTANAALIDGSASGVRSPTASGLTETTTAALIAGSASADRNATAAGATLTTSQSIVDGSASGVRSPTQAGATITTTAQIVPGSASAAGNATAAGVTLTTTQALVAGSASGQRNVSASGLTLTTSETITTGAASGGSSATATGAVISSSSVIVSGVASGQRNVSTAGATISTSAAIVSGSASAGSAVTAPGAALATTAAVIAGSASGVRSPVAIGSTITVSAAFLSGSATGSRSATANGADISTGADLADGQASGSATAGGTTIETDASILAGSATISGYVAGATFSLSYSFASGSASGEVNASPSAAGRTVRAEPEIRTGRVANDIRTVAAEDNGRFMKTERGGRFARTMRGPRTGTAR